jgi:hypothetical protein
MSQSQRLVRRILEMNTDLGFFHLSIGLRSMRPANSLPRTCEPSSEDEPKLPEIDYSRLGSSPLHSGRRQRYQCRRHLFPADALKKSPLYVLPALPIVARLTKRSST